MYPKIELAALENESDVEQKLIYPILTLPPPEGLGISPSWIHTKKNIRRLNIGKGSDTKSYFPDYIISVRGLPLVVIEGKGPGVDMAPAFREARLYAHEINSLYAPDVDPVSLVIACNGTEFWIGSPNHAHPKLKIRFEDLAPYSSAFAELSALANDQVLEDLWLQVQTKIEPQKRWKPRAMLGGQAVQDEVLPKNQFGSTISANLGPIFNPTTKAERAKVARHAYITSNRRTRYVNPIDTIIRAATPLAHVDAKLIDDTEKPTTLVEKLGQGRSLEHQLILLVGGAGAGKTTFIDYLQEVALPRDLVQQTEWVHLNMNVAPVTAAEIYNWLRRNIIRLLKESAPEVDFDDLDTLKSLYAVEINKFAKGRGKLYAHSETLYNEKLAEVLRDLEDDLHGTATAFCRFRGNERGRLIVLVLDNCDKRQRDEQLLMFEAAQWLRREFKALVVLPLREETYDHHRDEPPLDTALKDLVFRIEPPAFNSVLAKRIELARNELKTDEKVYRYELENSMHVEYMAADQGRYLSSIASSLFGGDKQIGRLLLGLAGSNLRKAFELFLEICNSGHMPSTELLKVKGTSGDYNIPIHFILRALLRQNRRFYDTNQTYIKNLFAIEEDDYSRLAFLRIAILRWLEGKAGEVGPTRLKGYFPISDLALEVGMYGFEPSEILRGVEELSKASCVLSEDFRTEGLDSTSLVRIGPAGLVHLDLLVDLNYWAAIAEDTYFDSKPRAQEIAARMGDPTVHYSLATAWHNAVAALGHMKETNNRLVAGSGHLKETPLAGLVDFDRARSVLSASAKSLGLTGWDTAAHDYPVGSKWDLKVCRIMPYGYFVDFPTKAAVGNRREPLPISGLLRKEDVQGALKVGDAVCVTITGVEPLLKRIHLVLASVID